MPEGMRDDVEGFEALEEGHRKTMFFAESVNMPGVSLSYTDVRRLGVGPRERVPFAPVFVDAAATIVSDAKSRVYDFWQSWIKLVMPHDVRGGRMDDAKGITASSRAYEATYRHRYVSDIRIVEFDPAGRIVKVGTMRDAFPIFLGDEQLSWADTNSIAKFVVQIAYTDWYQLTEYKSRKDERATIDPEMNLSRFNTYNGTFDGASFDEVEARMKRMLDQLFGGG